MFPGMAFQSHSGISVGFERYWFGRPHQQHGGIHFGAGAVDRGGCVRCVGGTIVGPGANDWCPRVVSEVRNGVAELGLCAQVIGGAVGYVGRL